MKTTRWTVVTVDEMGETNGRLGRWVSKTEAQRAAKLWIQHGCTGVVLVDETGRRETPAARPDLKKCA